MPAQCEEGTTKLDSYLVWHSSINRVDKAYGGDIYPSKQGIPIKLFFKVVNRLRIVQMADIYLCLCIMYVYRKEQNKEHTQASFLSYLISTIPALASEETSPLKEMRTAAHCMLCETEHASP